MKTLLTGLTFAGLTKVQDADALRASRVRLQIGVLVTVWGWSDERIDAEATILQHARDIVVEGLYYGSDATDIEGDVIDNCDDVFNEALLEPQDNGDLHIILIPAASSRD